MDDVFPTIYDFFRQNKTTCDGLSTNVYGQFACYLKNYSLNSPSVLICNIFSQLNSNKVIFNQWLTLCKLYVKNFVNLKDTERFVSKTPHAKLL